MSTTTPALQVWNRLEPGPRSNSIVRSLRAEVRDALWMLTRQWQLGEWNGEDTGTAAFARLDMQTSRIDRIAKPGNAALPFDDTMPWECNVEHEKIQSLPLVTRVELGRQYLKMLRAQGLNASTLTSVENLLRSNSTLKFTVPASQSANPEFFSNPELWQATQATTNGRAIDGFALVQYLKQPGKTVTTLEPGITGISGTAASAANAAGVGFVAWFNRVYAQPAGTTDDYWSPQHLEYQFACSAPRTANDYTLLKADEYYQGHLDWYSFDRVETQPLGDNSLSSLVNGPPDTTLVKSVPFTVIPSKISFGGMPAARFWEMEDHSVDFGGINVATTDTAHTLVGEFLTMYSNDWTILPYTVPTGSICNLRGIEVVDVFGQTTSIEAAGANDWNHWSMFNLSAVKNTSGDQRLFVPPVVGDLQESDPVEMVNFMRDEMANMVWGVETIVPDGVSAGERGMEAASRIAAFINSITPPSAPTFPMQNAAAIKYNVMSTVPENWIPYIPVRLGTNLASRNIQFQRAAMPRLINGNATTQRVRPRTTLQQVGYNGSTWGASYIYEEEIPRSGAILSLTWQRARTQDGRVALWLGRRKQNGRGEGSSGLRFDYLTAK